jgi:hypothetical protein
MGWFKVLCRNAPNVTQYSDKDHTIAVIFITVRRQILWEVCSQ